MKLFDNKNNCCGCLSCETACPKNAIDIFCDKKGFEYPKINKLKCIDCGICKKVCPLKNENPEKNTTKIYALKNKDEEIRKTSSSGGVFYEIAKYIIRKKGYVFGACYDSNLVVCHIGTNKLEELKKFKTSKYVQSNLKNTYRETEFLLKKSEIVLFSGTPCQIYGLKKYLKKDYDNLITCDNICHGVPSPKVFEDYKKYIERKFKSKIVSINFRYKKYNQTQVMKISFESGKEYFGKSNIDKYYKLFLSNIMLRESCYNCNFSNMKRVSDITMGDFWGIEKSINGFDDNLGVSLCIINTDKGENIFDKIKKSFILKESNAKDCLQQNLKNPTPKNINTEQFWEFYEKYGFEKAANKYAKTTFKTKIKDFIVRALEKFKIKNFVKKIIRR